MSDHVRQVQHTSKTTVKPTNVHDCSLVDMNNTINTRIIKYLVEASRVELVGHDIVAQIAAPCLAVDAIVCRSVHRALVGDVGKAIVAYTPFGRNYHTGDAIAPAE